MKALAVIPKQKESLHLREVEKPVMKDNELLVKVLEAGICGTDLEINQGLYGDAPEGCEYLIIGHESLGIVKDLGKNVKHLKKNDLVVRIVRRPCGNCINCDKNESDMCLTGKYTEVGIKAIHGVMAEYYTDSPEYLVKIPKKFRNIGVLMEPLSFVEKAVNQAMLVQKRLNWGPKRALVLGCGAIGILAAMVLRVNNLITYIVARSKKGLLKSEIVEKTGTTYISTSEENIEEFSNKTGKFDIIIESTGDSAMITEALKMLNNNGILILTSITGGNKKIEIDINKINIDMVLGNKVIIGVVNANIKDYKRGIKHLAEFEKRWHGLTEKLITKRIKLEEFKKGFVKDRQGIRTVIEFA